MRADVVDDEDVRVIELGCGAGFLLEAREAFGIRGEAWVNDLDGDVSREPRIPRLVDLTHPPCAERREDFVGTQHGAGGERHLVQPSGLTSSSRSRHSTGCIGAALSDTAAQNNSVKPAAIDPSNRIACLCSGSRKTASGHAFGAELVSSISGITYEPWVIALHATRP
jgi:hypothetical protein